MPAGSRQPCLACGSTDFREHRAREMQLGTRDEFTYTECVGCGSLALPDPPDLTPYYQHDDYVPGHAQDVSLPRLERLVKRAAFELGLRGVLRPRRWRTVRLAGIRQGDAILDVGSGRGTFLRHLERNGFRNLTGIDPFVEPDNLIQRVAFEDYDGGPFDAIFFHEAFEHLADPSATLRHAKAMLKPDGRIVISTPVADAYAWRTYGVDWFALDAPRHLFIPTRKSMRLLADAAGLTVSKLVDDSIVLQIWASEQYRQDVPLNDPRTVEFEWSPRRKEWERLTRELNARGDGDHATFLLEYASQPRRSGSIRGSS